MKPLLVSIAAAVAAFVISAPAEAGGYGGGGGGGGCHHGHIININKNWNYNKNINLNKNININKNIVIAKSNSISVAVAGGGGSAGAVVYGGSSVVETEVNRNVGDIGEVATEETCEMTEATIVKAIHAVCISSEGGREFPASHMLPDTWIDSSYEGEVARCIPGSRLKVMIGDVLQSDQGMAGAYDHGEVLDCAAGEALRHYKEGMLKCAPAVPVKDCTERTNLRRYGTGDMFFSYRGRVCATRTAARSDSTVSKMSLDGGVGPTSY